MIHEQFMGDGGNLAELTGNGAAKLLDHMPGLFSARGVGTVLAFGVLFVLARAIKTLVEAAIGGLKAAK